MTLVCQVESEKARLFFLTRKVSESLSSTYIEMPTFRLLLCTLDFFLYSNFWT